MTHTQPWTLVCLRETARLPSPEVLRAQFGGRVGCIVAGEVHPLDAEDYAESLGANVVLSMSKALIDVFAAASAEEVRQRLWFSGTDGKLRGLSPEQAEAFWRSYDTGVQHVSEILISQGLWY